MYYPYNVSTGASLFQFCNLYAVNVKLLSKGTHNDIKVAGHASVIQLDDSVSQVNVQRKAALRADWTRVGAVPGLQHAAGDGARRH